MIKKSLRVGSKLWVHCEGRTFVEETTTAAARAHHQSLGSGTILSPMPGKVLKVNFKIEDPVSAGQTVCVIEAMKMEYSLKAPFTGKIKQVWKLAGQQVVLGEKILEIVSAD